MSRLPKESSLSCVASTSQEGQEEEEASGLASNRSLRVTLLSSEWKSSKGGLSTINRELAIQLAKHPNLEVSVYLPNCTEEDKKVANSHDVELIKAKELPGFEPIDWLASLPENHHPHCVIGHGVHLGRQIPLIKRQHDCKWIQVVHTAPEELGMFKTYADAISKGEKKHQAEVKLCELADQVVAIGPKLADAYSRYLRSCQKDQDVLNLTPSIFTEFSEVKQASKERNTFCVLVFGRGDSEDFELKGYDIAVQAIAELKENSYQLMFVGAPSGKEDEIKARLLQYGIPRRQLTVRCFDESRERLARLLCEVDLAVMPSRTEGFGLTALEALSAGLPILVSGNSGLGEALKEVPTGSWYVVDSEDPRDWAKEIKTVRHKQREVRLAESKLLCEKYLEKYSWEKPSRVLVERMWNLTFGSTESRPAIPVKNKRPKSPVVADQPSKRRREETTDHDHCDGSFTDAQSGQLPVSAEFSQSASGGTTQSYPEPSYRRTHIQELEFSVEGYKSICRSKITEQGGIKMVKTVPARITYAPKALITPTEVTCSLWNPRIRSPPLGKNETIVSSVMELACGSLFDAEKSNDFSGKVKLALSHSASDLKGYELVIKELIDDESNDWKDLETKCAWIPSDVHDEHFGEEEVPGWLFPFAEAKITSWSSFAVVWRLKSVTFHRPPSTSPFSCTLPGHPGVSVTIPQSSFPSSESFALTVKVQEVPCGEYKQNTLPIIGPILHISSSKPLQLLTPATLKTPVTLRGDMSKYLHYSASDVRILCRSCEEDEPEWTEITEQLEKPADLENGIVTFEVNHFSEFWVWLDWMKQPLGVLKNLASDLYRRLMQQNAKFLGCLCNAGKPKNYVLTLCCFPLHLKGQVHTYLSSTYQVCYQGEGNSLKKLCKEDQAFVSFSEAFIVLQRGNPEDVYLRFLGDESFQRSLRVSVADLSDLNVEFYTREERETLCTLVFSPVSRVQASEEMNLKEPPFAVKNGVPKEEELDKLAFEIPVEWKNLGRRLLDYHEPTLDAIDKENETCNEKAYSMLLKWKKANGSGATFRVLYDALCDTGLKELAEKFCLSCHDSCTD